MSRIAVPSVSFWQRDEVIRARHLQYEACKHEHNPESGVIIIAPDDDILCDFCNAEIEDVMINMVDFGSRAVCDQCYQKHYANEPVKYRELMEDGRLGGYLKGGG